MAAVTFADAYRSAGLSPTPDAIRLRQQAHEKLRKAINERKAVDLARLYFGFNPKDLTWFTGPFSEADPTFSMHDNSREAAVLAGCLLDSALEDANNAAALALLDMSVSGARQPVVRPELVEQARKYVHDRGIAVRQRVSVNLQAVKAPKKSNVPGEADQLAQAPAWPQAVAVFKSVAEESHQNVATLVTQVSGVLKTLAEQGALMREELDVLWWYVGGWSRILERPFLELEPALVATLAGLDLADLSSDVGPAAAPAILSRVLTAGRSAVPEKVTLAEAVDAFPAEKYDTIAIGHLTAEIPDAMPVLAAFVKAREVGASPSWHVAFERDTRLSPGLEIQPLDLALQVYRESLLARTLNGK